MMARIEARLMAVAAAVWLAAGSAQAAPCARGGGADRASRDWPSRHEVALRPRVRAASCGASAQRPQEARLVLAGATEPGVGRSSPAGRAAPGTLEWARVATLGFAVGGVVAAVPVAPGQRVASGALLARLDTRPFDARVRERQARVDGLVPAYEEARREHERAEALFERMVISAHERELRRIAYVRAEAALREARAALTQARIEREYAELRAPFAGYVVAVHVAPGQAVAAGLRVEPAVSLAETGRMAVRVALERRPRLRPGETVRVRVDGRALEARVEAVRQEADGWVLRVTFTVPEGLALVPGGPAEVALP